MRIPSLDSFAAFTAAPNASIAPTPAAAATTGNSALDAISGILDSIAPSSTAASVAGEVATAATPVPATATTNYLWWYVGGGFGLLVLYLIMRK